MTGHEYLKKKERKILSKLLCRKHINNFLKIKRIKEKIEKNRKKKKRLPYTLFGKLCENIRVGILNRRVEEIG